MKIFFSIILLIAFPYCSSTPQKSEQQFLSGLWVIDLQATKEDLIFKKSLKVDPSNLAKIEFLNKTMSLDFQTNYYIAKIDFTVLPAKERAKEKLPNTTLEDRVKIVDLKKEGDKWVLKIKNNKSGMIDRKIIEYKSEDLIIFSSDQFSPDDFPLHLKKKL